MGMGKKLISIKIQAFQIPISKTGIAGTCYFLSKIFSGKMYVVDGVYPSMVILSIGTSTRPKQHYFTGQYNLDAKHGNIIDYDLLVLVNNWKTLERDK